MCMLGGNCIAYHNKWNRKWGKGTGRKIFSLLLSTPWLIWLSKFACIILWYNKTSNDTDTNFCNLHLNNIDIKREKTPHHRASMWKYMQSNILLLRKRCNLFLWMVFWWRKLLWKNSQNTCSSNHKKKLLEEINTRPWQSCTAKMHNNTSCSVLFDQTLNVYYS